MFKGLQVLDVFLVLYPNTVVNPSDTKIEHEAMSITVRSIGL